MSSITTVSGSFISTMPVSSSAVVTQIAFEPDMAWAWSACRMMKPASAPSRRGGTSRLTEPSGPDRGSRQQKRRIEFDERWFDYTSPEVPEGSDHALAKRT